jgi:hypothetical protein
MLSVLDLDPVRRAASTIRPVFEGRLKRDRRFPVER